MPRHHHDNDSARYIIPNVRCPRCGDGMRLALMEPGAMTPSGRDTLVFECVCGFAYRTAVHNPDDTGL